jgi:phenylacetate-CoA ligase
MANWLVKSYWSAFGLWNLRQESRLPYWPLDKVLAIQRRRIRSIVNHAYRYVPFYREAMLKAGLRPDDFQTAEDLERLPLVTKEELALAPGRFRSRRHHDKNGLTLQSSGTSGQAVSIATNAAALFLALAHGHRRRLAMAGFVGRSLGYREAEIVRLSSVNTQVRGFYNSHSWTPAGIDLQRLQLPVDAPFEQNLERLNDFRPDAVVGYGSYLGAFFRSLHAHRIPFHRPKLICYGGDPMPDAERSLIEQELNIPVWSAYQASEAMRIAYQCELRQGFHLDLDQVAVRVIDQRGNRVGPGGTGEFVVSNLTSVFNWEANTSRPDFRYMPAIIRFLGYNPLPPADSLAQRLARHRTSLGLSLKGAAQRIGVDAGTLARWERGEREPEGGMLASAVRFLRTSEVPKQRHAG